MTPFLINAFRLRHAMHSLQILFREPWCVSAFARQLTWKFFIDLFASRSFRGNFSIPFGLEATGCLTFAYATLERLNTTCLAVKISDTCTVPTLLCLLVIAPTPY